MIGFEYGFVLIIEILFVIGLFEFCFGDDLSVVVVVVVLWLCDGDVVVVISKVVFKCEGWLVLVFEDFE